MSAYLSFWKRNVEPLLRHMLVGPKDNVVEIFQALLELEGSLQLLELDITETWSAISGLRPSLALAIDALLEVQDSDISVVDPFMNTLHSKSALITSLIASAPNLRHNADTGILRSYASLSVPAHDRFSFRFPPSWTDLPAQFLKVPGQESISESLSFSPPGWVSPPHISRQFTLPTTVHHISGNMLWFLWPATSKNIEVVEKLFLISTTNSHMHGSMSVMRAIRQLEGMRIAPLSKPSTFIIPAWEITAAIGLTATVYLSLSPLSPNLFRESMSTLNRVCDRYEVFARQLRESETKAMEETLVEMFRSLLMWQQLVTAGNIDDGNRQFHSELHDAVGRLHTIGTQTPYNFPLELPQWWRTPNIVTGPQRTAEMAQAESPEAAAASERTPTQSTPDEAYHGRATSRKRRKTKR